MNTYRFKDYLEQIVAQGLKKKKREDIQDEFLSHLEDKADWLTEIGYEEEAAAEKTVSEMGDTAEVREKLFKLHEEKWGKIIAFIVLLSATSFYAMFKGFAYLTFVDTASEPKIIHVIVSVIYMFFIILLLYRNYRFRKAHIALALSIYFLIAAIFTTFLSAPTQPVFYALAEILNATIGTLFFGQGKGTDFYFFGFGAFVLLGSSVFNAACAAFSFYTSKKMGKTPVYKTPPKRKNNTPFIVLITASVLFTVVMPAGYYQSCKVLGHHIDPGYFEKNQLLEEVTVQTEEIFDNLEFGMPLNEADAIIRNGNKSILYKDCEKTQYDVYIKGDSSKNYHLMFRKGDIYRNFDAISIHVFFDTKGKLESKMYDTTTMNVYSYKKIASVDKMIKTGMEKSKVLEMLYSKHVFPNYVVCELKNGKSCEYYSIRIQEIVGTMMDWSRYEMTFENGMLVQNEILKY